MNRLLALASIRALRHHPWQLALALLGIALGVGGALAIALENPDTMLWGTLAAPQNFIEIRWLLAAARPATQGPLAPWSAAVAAVAVAFFTAALITPGHRLCASLVRRFQ